MLLDDVQVLPILFYYDGITCILSLFYLNIKTDKNGSEII